MLFSLWQLNMHIYIQNATQSITSTYIIHRKNFMVMVAVLNTWH